MFDAAKIKIPFETANFFPKFVSKYYVYVSSLRFEPYNICAIWENIVYLQHSFVLI